MQFLPYNEWHAFLLMRSDYVITSLSLGLILGILYPLCDNGYAMAKLVLADGRCIAAFCTQENVIRLMHLRNMLSLFLFMFVGVFSACRSHLYSNTGTVRHNIHTAVVWPVSTRAIK